MSKQKDKKNRRMLREAVSGLVPPQRMNQLGELGLGAVLDVGPGDLTEFTLLWEFEHHTFPLTTNQFNRLVNSERSVLGCTETTDPDDDCTIRRSPYLNCGTSFNCPFLMTSLCVVVVADGEQFGVRGVYNATQPVANSEIPQIPPYDLESGDSVHSNGLWGLTPALASIVPAGAWSHAVLNWGQPVLRFLEQWLMATRLQIVVCNKLLVIDELLAAIGMCMMAPTYQGAGMAGLGTGPYIRCVNEAMQDKELGVFLTVNVDDDSSTTVCLPQPMVTYMKGATQIPGGPGNKNGHYRFDPGIFLSPYMGAQFNFVNNTDEDCICPLQTTSTVTTQSPHPNYLQDVANITNSCGNDTFIPGGQMEIGVMVDGYEMSAMAVAAWIARMAEGYSTTEGLTPRQARMLGQLQSIHEMGHSQEGYQYLRGVVEQARARADKSRRESTRQIASRVAGFLEGPRPE